MSFQENDCDKFQDFCMDEHNAVDCGIPLLNISVHCQLDNRTMVSELQSLIQIREHKLGGFPLTGNTVSGPNNEIMK